MTEPESVPEPFQAAPPPSRLHELQRRVPIPASARERIRIPGERLRQSAGAAATVTRSGVAQVRTQAGSVRHRLRQRMNQNGRIPAGQNGAPVPRERTLVVITSNSRSSDIIARIAAPLMSLRDAFMDHWQDTIREAKLAAREKETELRADYERRVVHDPRLHVEQLKPTDREK